MGPNSIASAKSVKAVAAALALAALELSSCSDVSFVDEVVIMNETAYSATVEITDESREAWLGLTDVEPESTTTIRGVIDQGETWIFRFHYVARHAEEIELSRQDLQAGGWMVEVPQSFEQRLRDMGVPPPP